MIVKIINGTEKKIAVDDSVIEALVNEYGSKNLLPTIIRSQTINGVTFTINNDGSVTANGTATVKTWFNLYFIADPTIYNSKFKGKKLIFSGCQNGSYSSYYLSMEMNGSSFVNNSDNDTIVTMPDFKSSFNVYCVIAQNITVSNIVFYPMLRDARIKDNTYVPYTMTNYDLTQVACGPSWYNTYNKIASISNKYPNTIDEDIDFGANGMGLYGVMFWQGAGWRSQFHILEVTRYHVDLQRITSWSSNNPNLSVTLKSEVASYPIIVNFKTTAAYSGECVIFKLF